MTRVATARLSKVTEAPQWLAQQSCAIHSFHNLIHKDLQPRWHIFLVSRAWTESYLWITGCCDGVSIDSPVDGRAKFLAVLTIVSASMTCVPPGPDAPSRARGPHAISTACDPPPAHHEDRGEPAGEQPATAPLCSGFTKGYDREHCSWL